MALSFKLSQITSIMQRLSGPSAQETIAMRAAADAALEVLQAAPGLKPELSCSEDGIETHNADAVLVHACMYSTAPSMRDSSLSRAFSTMVVPALREQGQRGVYMSNKERQGRVEHYCIGAMRFPNG